MKEQNIKFDKALIKSFLINKDPEYNRNSYRREPYDDLPIYEDLNFCHNKLKLIENFESYLANYELVLAQATSACILAQAAPSKETKTALALLQAQVQRGLEYFIPITVQIRIGTEYESGYDDYDNYYEYYGGRGYEKTFVHLDGTYYPEYTEYNFKKGGRNEKRELVPSLLINDILERGAEVMELLEKTQQALSNAPGKKYE